MKTRLSFTARYDCGTPTTLPYIGIGRFHYAIGRGPGFGIAREARKVADFVLTNQNVSDLKDLID